MWQWLFLTQECFARSSVASMVFACAGTLVIISIISPLFLVVLFPILFLYRFVERRYLVVSRELKVRL